MPKKLLFCAALVSAFGWLLAPSSVCAAASSPVPVVKTDTGRLRGVERDGVVAFLGVPYARPPVGALRWRAPRPAVPWSGVREATRFGAACLQDPPMANFGPYTPEFLQTPGTSEDCLSLNVWTPSGAAHSGHSGANALPVLVWIHGGAFQGGSGAVPIYDGARLASHGAVVVSINYRLGVFGFFSHPALRRESPLAVSGNYGLQDQIAALQWLRRNVARFGGDPHRVVIAGQSAGAASVLDLMAMPEAKGLFAGAIAQSGLGMSVDALALGEAESMWQTAAQEVGFASLAELRAAPAEAVQQKLRPRRQGQALPFPVAMRYLAPVVDGKRLLFDGTVPPAGARWSSEVPLISGFNADEGFLMGYQRIAPAAFEAWVAQTFGDSAPALSALYPHADDQQASEARRLLARDRYMASLLIHAERVASTRKNPHAQPVRAYLFEHPYPGSDAARFGTFHTAEVPYLFGNLDATLRPFTAADEAISTQLQRYWLAFARGGLSGLAGLPEWPPVEVGGGQVMGLGDHVGLRSAVSSPERLQALRDHAARGGRLGLF